MFLVVLHQSNTIHIAAMFLHRACALLFATVRITAMVYFGEKIVHIASFRLGSGSVGSILDPLPHPLDFDGSTLDPLSHSLDFDTELTSLYLLVLETEPNRVKSPESSPRTRGKACQLNSAAVALMGTISI